MSLEAVANTSRFNGQPIDALLVAGGLDADVTTHLQDRGLSLYRVSLGSSADAAGGEFGLTEVLRGRLVSMLRLERLEPHGRSRLVAQMAVQTHVCSAARTRATLMATLPVFLELALRRMLDAGTDADATEASDSEESDRAEISVGVSIRHTASLMNAIADRAANRSQWLLAVMPRPAAGQPWQWRQLRPLAPPADRNWADPFLVRRDGQSWVFFEEAPFRSAKGRDIGHISVAPINSDGFTGPVRRALDLPWHLSHPCVFAHEGTWYMVPESGSQESVGLYRCTAWPDQWVRHSTLIDQYRGFDPSVFQIGERFWMFVARFAAGGATADFLDLYSAPSPLGPWRLHPSSPIVRDVRCARPAGRPFVHGDHWVRPAQDSSGGVYGRALRLQEITRIDDESFSEKPWKIVEPNQVEGILGIHSFACDEDIVLVDVCRKVSRIDLMRRFQSALPERLII
jgi:hypothetical protein